MKPKKQGLKQLVSSQPNIALFVYAKLEDELNGLDGDDSKQEAARELRAA